MNAAHSENLEYLKRIRGCFGSHRLWSIEYVFTGEAIIERRGERIRNQVRISDIVETSVRLGFKGLNRMILKTNNSKMTIPIIPSLNEVIMKLAAKFNAHKSEPERKHLEEAARQTVSRFRRASLVGTIATVLFTLAFGILVIGWIRKHY